MTLFETLGSYETVAHLDDHIALETLELNPEYKHETFKVVDIFRGRLTLRPHYSRKRIILEDEQQVNLLTEQDFKNLKEL